MAKKGLGRGLGSLLADNAIDELASNGITMLKISDVEPNRGQARTHFDESALLELADSIGKHGILQPITVRMKENGFYEIIAGERRWRASKIAGFNEIPAVIKEVDDKTASELSLIENLQRENLNAAEEARGYKDLMDRFGLTQEEAAERVGKSREAVANIVRLLKLPDSVLALVEDNSLSYGHARTLIKLTKYFDDSDVLDCANYVISKGLSVRQTEKYVDSVVNSTNKTPKIDDNKVSNTYYKKIETDMSEALGRKAIIRRAADGNGKLTLSFSSSEDLESLIELICGKDFFSNN